MSSSMRTGASRHSLAGALFTATQQRVLGLLFGQPDRSFFATEIIKRLGTGSGSVQRELARLVDSGLAKHFQVGNQKHYQANPESPIFHELCSIVRKTIGVFEPLREALKPMRSAITLALVYGSVVKGRDTAASDIDLLLVSDSLTLETVYRHLEAAESALGRPINPTLYTCAEFEHRLQAGSSFLARVLADDTIVLIGTLPS